MPSAAGAAPEAAAEPREPLTPEERRAMLRDMSHDLRTPLNAIIGFADLMSSEVYGPLGCDQYREYAAIIRDAGRRLLQEVNAMIESARLENAAD